MLEGKSHRVLLVAVLSTVLMPLLHASHRVATVIDSPIQLPLGDSPRQTSQELIIEYKRQGFALIEKEKKEAFLKLFAMEASFYEKFLKGKFRVLYVPARIVRDNDGKEHKYSYILLKYQDTSQEFYLLTKEE